MQPRLFDLEYSDRTFILRVTVSSGLAAPAYPRPQPDAPPALVGRLTDWCDRRFKLGYDFGRVEKLLVQLNAYCRTIEVARYVWPAILSLCPDNEQGRDLAKRLNAFKVPRDPPVLPVAVREACRLAAATVTGAALIAGPSDHPVDRPASSLSMLAGNVLDEQLGRIERW